MKKTLTVLTASAAIVLAGTGVAGARPVSDPADPPYVGPGNTDYFCSYQAGVTVCAYSPGAGQPTKQIVECQWWNIFCRAIY